ncbi:ABC transporter permease [Streptomyces albidus (ex Kaewkla and Franco 2022)]|uniref:ABC transporter permease n=1 Tax=Streptomyces albidus (ex Kaewkla and Franco 2022) TaxID=722709 RepID=UPI0015EF993F|nr:ABC transporter permease [Streptomyces albidus (ex Kaewkla and Franco 2022)]
MTVPTIGSRRPESAEAPDRSGAARGPRGLLWLTLRTHRAALWCWTILVAALVGWLMWLYGQGAEADRFAGYESCGTGPGVPECPSFDYMGAFDIGAAVIAWTPFAVAAYAGGVLVARDLENGTAALSWTQSVSPARWLTVRLAAASAVVLAGTLLLTTAIRWVWTSYDKSLVNPWYMSDVFHATGVVSLAYTVLAVAVGALAGLLAKRTLPAMGLAFGAFLPVYVAADMYRARLWPTTHLSGLKASQVPDDADQISLGLITDDGRRINELDCFDSETSARLERCLDHEGGRDVFAQIHPASHYWPIQFVETGIVLALAAVVIWAAFRLLRQRTAS